MSDDDGDGNSCVIMNTATNARTPTQSEVDRRIKLSSIHKYVQYNSSYHCLMCGFVIIFSFKSLFTLSAFPVLNRLELNQMKLYLLGALLVQSALTLPGPWCPPARLEDGPHYQPRHTKPQGGHQSLFAQGGGGRGKTTSFSCTSRSTCAEPWPAASVLSAASYALGPPWPSHAAVARSSPP